MVVTGAEVVGTTAGVRSVMATSLDVGDEADHAAVLPRLAGDRPVQGAARGAVDVAVEAHAVAPVVVDRVVARGHVPDVAPHSP